MSLDIWDYLNPLDEEELSRSFHAAQPTRYFVVDDFLQSGFLREVAGSYPSYEEALEQGFQFKAVNENLKIQVTDPEVFPKPVGILHEILSSPAFIRSMVNITGIQNLRSDEELSGGGMHIMGSSGRLDVHVDFNLIEARNLYRRLNILVFMNETWHQDWGGNFEIWDPEVKHCLFAAEPLLNRCVVFNTTEVSYHGVTPIRCPKGVTRNSFAAYYYTAEAPEGTDGSFHSTLFRARPNEWFRGRLMVPAEKSAKALREGLSSVKRTILRQPKDED